MILNFEFYNHVVTRLRYLDAGTAAIPTWRPDGHDAAYCAGLVTAAKDSLIDFLGFYNANNTAAGALAAKFEQCHDCAVSVYGCMKSCFRDNPGVSASIRRLPKKDFNAATTYLRMRALIDLWGTLPKLASTNAPFTAGSLTQEQFDTLSGGLDASMRAARIAEAEMNKDLRRFSEQNEAWDRFVTAALAQGRSLFPEGSPERAVIDRVPTEPATQLPGAVNFVTAESKADRAVTLQFTADHATTAKVYRKGPGETEFAEVDDVLAPGGAGEYLASGLPGGTHQYKVVGVNSRGNGPESSVVSVEVAAEEVA